MAEKRPANGDRVSNRQLYDTLTALEARLLSRREGYIVIGSALMLGQIAARLDISTFDFARDAAVFLAHLLLS